MLPQNLYKIAYCEAILAEETMQTVTQLILIVLVSNPAWALGQI
jgi:hypothetical protein